MKLEPIGNINFGIYKQTIKKPYGYVDIGEYRDKIIEIYHSFNQVDGTLLHKLYYIKDKVEGWMRSKLKYYKNNRCDRVINSRKFETRYV